MSGQDLSAREGRDQGLSESSAIAETAPLGAARAAGLEEGAAVDAAAIPVGLLREEVQEVVAEEKRVTSLELFFDLVFVFAITQVSGFVSASPDWTRLLEGLAILSVLWFAWTGYAWLGNTADADEGHMRLLLFAAMGAMLVTAIAVPHAFGSDALIFGIAYFAVRAMHLAIYTYVARSELDDNPELGRVVGRLATTVMPAAALLVLGGALGGEARTACWVAALTIDYGGILIRGVEGWRINPGHFAERHSLVILIALGESIVSLGVGADRLPLGVGVITASLLGLAVAGALWWAYFDVVAIVGERRLRHADAGQQALIARDSYSYLHLPMMAGIVVFAVGVKRTLIELHAHLEIVPATALCGGIALYLLGLSAFKRRNIGSWNTQRLIVAALLVAMIPLATAIPALLALGLVTAVTCGLIAFEVVRYTETRQRIRHAQTD